MSRALVDDGLMIAVRRVDVAELNRLARERRKDLGLLHGLEIDLPGGSFAVGDRVVVRRNDRRSGLDNGDRGIVPAIERDVLELECSGRRVRLGFDFLPARTAHGDPTLMHGYAVTVHVAQGITVDRAHVLARESGYKAMSRGREANHLYVAEEVRAREELAPADLTRPTAVGWLVNDVLRSDAQGLVTRAHGRVRPRDRPVGTGALCGRTSRPRSPAFARDRMAERGAQPLGA